MTYFMARSFDHGGYYETRLVLAVASLAFAVWMARARADRRYLVMFASGALFQGLMELLITKAGLRGAGYSPTVFGWALPSPWVFVLQGVAEGGPLSLMAFWFGDLAGKVGDRSRWYPFLAALTGIVALSVIVSLLAAGQPYTSVRPIFRWDALWLLILIGSIAGTALGRGRPGLKQLFLFAAGVTVYLIATYEPMHLAGVRLIVEKTVSADTPHPAGLFAQLWVMAYSHLVEVPGSKLHFFAIPLLLGLLGPKRRALS